MTAADAVRVLGLVCVDDLQRADAALTEQLDPGRAPVAPSACDRG
jgi:hypothetical protein